MSINSLHKGDDDDDDVDDDDNNNNNTWYRNYASGEQASYTLNCTWNCWF